MAYDPFPPPLTEQGRLLPVPDRDYGEPREWTVADQQEEADRIEDAAPGISDRPLSEPREIDAPPFAVAGAMEHVEIAAPPLTEPRVGQTTATVAEPRYREASARTSEPKERHVAGRTVSEPREGRAETRVAEPRSGRAESATSEPRTREAGAAVSEPREGDVGRAPGSRPSARPAPSQPFSEPREANARGQQSRGGGQEDSAEDLRQVRRQQDEILREMREVRVDLAEVTQKIRDLADEGMKL